MTIRNVKTFVDYLFLTTVVFFFSCVWCNFHFRSISKSFVPAIIITVAFLCFAFVFFRTRKEKTAAKKKEAAAIKEMFVELLHIKDGGEWIKNLFNAGDAFVCVHITKNAITEQHIIDAVAGARDAGKNKIAFFCEKTDIKVQTIARSYNDFEFNFFDAQKIYLMLKEADKLPVKTINTKPQRITLKQFFGLLIARERLKSYLYLSIFLSITCFFTPFKIYYACFASLFFVLAVCARFWKVKT